jgi:hypothetical protein
VSSADSNVLSSAGKNVRFVEGGWRKTGSR